MMAWWHQFEYDNFYVLIWLYVTAMVFSLEFVVIQAWRERKEVVRKVREAWQALPRCPDCGAMRVSVQYHAAHCKGHKGINVGVHAFKKGERRW